MTEGFTADGGGDLGGRGKFCDWWWPFSIGCHAFDTDILRSDLAEDERMETAALRGVESNVPKQQDIYDLAFKNEQMDTLRLTGNLVEMTQRFPELLGKTVDQASDILGQYRDKNNKLIDQLLGEANAEQQYRLKHGSR